MTKYVVLIWGFLFLVSCGKKEAEDPNSLSQEDQISYAETGESNLSEIKKSGTFEGEIKGKKVSLSFNDEGKYELTLDGKTKSGTWYDPLGDGSRMNLENSYQTVKYLKFSDQDNLIILNNEIDSLQNPDRFYYLNRVKE